MLVAAPLLLKHPVQPEAAKGSLHDLPAWGEALVFLTAIVTYLVSDLVYGGHFLAATLGLGEGFLALTALRALRAAEGASILRWPLRQGRSWTLLGVTCVGLFLLSWVPLFQAGAFKWLRWNGLRLDPATAAFSRDSMWEATEGRPASLENDLSPSRGAMDPEARRRLEEAARSYRRALDFFPSHLQTRYLLLGAYARLGDRRALDEIEEIARRKPGDPEVRELKRWAYVRFGAPLPH
jgi:hypothetical protein